MSSTTSKDNEPVNNERFKDIKEASISNIRSNAVITDTVMNQGSDLGDTQGLEYFYFDNSSTSLTVSLINITVLFILMRTI